jgi:hypothetical protein
MRGGRLVWAGGGQARPERQTQVELTITTRARSCDASAQLASEEVGTRRSGAHNELAGLHGAAIRATCTQDLHSPAGYIFRHTASSCSIQASARGLWAAPGAAPFADTAHRSRLQEPTGACGGSDRLCGTTNTSVGKSAPSAGATIVCSQNVWPADSHKQSVTQPGPANSRTCIPREDLGLRSECRSLLLPQPDREEPDATASPDSNVSLTNPWR